MSTRAAPTRRTLLSAPNPATVTAQNKTLYFQMRVKAELVMLNLGDQFRKFVRPLYLSTASRFRQTPSPGRSGMDNMPSESKFHFSARRQSMKGTPARD